MLSQKVFIYNEGSPIVVHDVNQYDFYLYFQASAMAKFLRVGDVVIANSNGLEYRVLSWFDQPSAYPDGGKLTVEAVGTNSAPSEDADYDSDLYTPDLIDYSSPVSTYGSCSSPSLADATNFEYNLTVSLPIGDQATKVAVGDYLSDQNGVIFKISYINPTTRFSDPIKCVDIDQLGSAPYVGNINVWRPTGKYKLSSPHGSLLTQEVLTKIRNRDLHVVDYNTTYDKERYIATLSDSNNGYIVLTSNLASQPDIEVQTYMNGIMLDWNEYRISASSKKMIFSGQTFSADDKFFILYERKVVTI